MEKHIRSHMLEKISSMKLLILMSLFFTCSTVQENNSFNKYLKGFMTHDLPFKVKMDNIYAFNDMIYDTNTDRHIKNVYLVIDTSNYIFLRQKRENKNKNNITYRYLYQFTTTKDYHPVIILEDYFFDDEINEMWFHLYIYNNDGNIIDDKVIGGYKIDYKEQYFTIDKELNITSTMFEFLPSPDGDDSHLYAKRVIKKYNITDTGKIFTQSTTEKKAKFEITKTGYVELK